MTTKDEKPDCRYSGKASTEFWERINKIPESRGGKMLYVMGCILQDIESRVLWELQGLEELERKRKRRVQRHVGPRD